MGDAGTFAQSRSAWCCPCQTSLTDNLTLSVGLSRGAATGRTSATYASIVRSSQHDADCEESERQFVLEPREADSRRVYQDDELNDRHGCDARTIHTLCRGVLNLPHESRSLDRDQIGHEFRKEIARVGADLDKAPNITEPDRVSAAEC